MGMRMDDRLSALSNDVILKILSLVDLKDGIRTSVLSLRWRYLWTSIPRLSFSSQDFSTIDIFSNVVFHVLSSHNNQLEFLNLYIRGGADANHVAQRIIDYALSLNLQQFKVTCLFGNHTHFISNKSVAFPLSLSGSHTLKHLTLSHSPRSYDQTLLTSAQEFSCLTTLHLYFITLHDAFLSMCPNLETLTLHGCKAIGSDVLRICHPRLFNLTLENGALFTHTIDVVAPKLKNLTILRCLRGFQVSAPKLASLFIRGPCPSMFSTDGLHSLEKALLSFRSLDSLGSSGASTIISLLQQFHNVKLLSLNMEIIQFLNSYGELISHQLSPLANLKSLRILPKGVCQVKHEHTRVIMSSEVKNFLLSSSPKATLTEVLRKECCDRVAGVDPDSFAYCPLLVQ